MTTRKYQQRARAAAAQETRGRILEAIRERLREAPSEAVSVDQVARMAGVARSTVYVIFGSRAGLFDALAQDFLQRAGFDRLVAAVQEPDARDHLRGTLTANVEMFAAERDLARALFATARLDPDALAGAGQRLESERAGGNQYLAQRLHDEGWLRPGLTVAEATDILWVLASFDAFDLLHSDRGLPPADVAERLVTMAESTLLATARS
jgi:AcrR family transcriptional regulator